MGSSQLIARFIYTDCEASGPFTVGVGKKFKSVAFPQGLGAAASVESLRDRLPKNSLTDGFVLPKIPDSMTMAEFDALPKSWAFAQIGPDTFAFERIATAGKCYGRDNRIDEGFIFDSASWPAIASRFAQATKPVQLRPADFVHSTGWLHVRGTDELEAATLDDGFYELEPNFREQLKSDIALVKRLPNLATLTRAFAHAQLNGEAIFVPKSQSADFFSIVGVLTRLTAPTFAWQTGFSDVWVKPRDKGYADGNNPHFLISDDHQPMPSALATAWGNLATEVFASGVPGKLMAKLDDLATNVFAVNPAKREQGLSLLPLAILLTDSSELAGKEHLIQLAADLIEHIELPQGWLGDAQSRTLDNAQNAVYRNTLNSESIEAKLTNIGGAA